MRGVIATEWLKLRRRRMTWILLGLTPVVMGVLYGLLFVSAATADANAETAAEWDARLSLANAVTFGDAMVYRLAALFCIIFAGSMTANEFGWRTVLPFTTWTGDARRLLPGKLWACGIVAAGFVLAGWAAVFVGVLAGNAAQGTLDGGEVSGTLTGDLAMAVPVTWAAAMVYGVIAAAIAVWTRSAAGAIAIPLGVLLLEPLGAAGLVALGGVAETIAGLTLSRNIDALLAATGPVRGAGEDLSGYPPAWRGALFLAMFCGVTSWLAIRSLGRRDFQE